MKFSHPQFNKGKLVEGSQSAKYFLNFTAKRLKWQESCFNAVICL